MNQIITISREYGSGGREIGQKLSESLGVPFYDKRLIVLASEKSGLHPDIIKNADEQSINTFFYSIPTMGSGSGFIDLSLQDKVFLSETQVIKDLAKQGPCVIVGRCADYILHDQPNCINIFIHSDLQSKVNRAVNDYAIPRENAADYIKKVDKKRASYYKHYSNNKWGDASNFHLTINSDSIGITNTISLIKKYINLKEQ